MIEVNVEKLRKNLRHYLENITDEGISITLHGKQIALLTHPDRRIEIVTPPKTMTKEEISKAAEMLATKSIPSPPNPLWGKTVEEVIDNNSFGLGLDAAEPIQDALNKRKKIVPQTNENYIGSDGFPDY